MEAQSYQGSPAHSDDSSALTFLYSTPYSTLRLKTLYYNQLVTQ